MVRPGNQGLVDAEQASESLRSFSLRVVDKNGALIFKRNRLSNFGALPHLDQELYGDFFVADEWIEKNMFKRLFVRPGAEATVICGRDEEDQELVSTFDYPGQEVPLEVAHSFAILNPEGKEVFRMEGVANWHFLIELDPKGHPRAIALDKPIGNYFRRTCVLAGACNTLVVEGCVTFKA
jgi:hypothetical protein